MSTVQGQLVGSRWHHEELIGVRLEMKEVRLEAAQVEGGGGGVLRGGD